MRPRSILLLLASHLAVGVVGFAVGVYALPILIAPPAPSAEVVSKAAEGALFKGRFRRDLRDSDAFHWGEGDVSIGREVVSLAGRVAPGPDYKLYLSPEFVETEADFARLKPKMVRIGDVKTFENFVVRVPPDVNVSDYSTVIVWCETFGQFITAAKYR